MGDIFPGLPEELGRECLVRVCYRCHSTVRAICKRWRREVDSPWFYRHRKRSSVSEHCIFLIQALPQIPQSPIEKTHTIPTYALTVYDPLRKLWQRQLPPFPELANGIPLFSECVAVKNRVILIGGWNPKSWEAVKSVYVVDVSCGKWVKGADMPSVRSFFACSVSDGLLYVAGGHDENKRALKGGCVYDVEGDKWEILPEMFEERDECRGGSIDGKFYVISGYESESQGRFKESGEVYDPVSGEWRIVQKMWPNWGCPPSSSFISAFNGIYAFHRGGVWRYESKGNEWKQMVALPQGIDCVRGAAVWRDGMLVTGAGAGAGGGGGGGTAQSCYLLQIPFNTNGSGSKSEKWIPLERPQNFTGIVQSVATLEI